MSITARDLFFVLRVRDEASNALNGVSRDLFKIGAAAEAAGKRSEAAGLRQLAANKRAAAAAEDERAKILRRNGATQNEINEAEAAAAAHRKEAADINKAAVAVDGEAAALERAARKQSHFAKTIQDTGKVLTLTGIAMVGVGAVGVAALLSTTKSAMEYGKQVALTKTQVDGFHASLQQISKIGIDVANNIAVPFKEVQPALYDIFSSTDANLKQATMLLQAFGKAAVAGNVSIQDSSRATMGIMNAFKIPFQDVNKVLDIQFQLVRKGVGTYGQFANVIGRAVPSTVRYGQSLDTLAASLAFLTRNGLSPAMAAASTARAFDALDNPTAVENLKAIGVQVQDSAGHFRPFIQVMTELRSKIMAMPAKDRVKAIFNLFKGAGGTIQARRFIDQLLLKPGQIESLLGFYKDMKGSTGQFQSAYGGMSKSVAAQSQLLNNKWNTLKVTVGTLLLPVLVQLVTWLNKLFTWFEHLSPTTQKMIVYGLLFVSVLAILVGIVVVVVGGILTLVGAAAALGLGFGEIAAIIAGLVIAIVGFFAAIVIAIKHSDALKKAWDAIKTKVAELRDALVTAWNKIKDTYNKHLKPALDDLWNTIQTKIIPVVMQFVGWAMNIWNTKIKEALRVVTGFIQKGLIVLGWVITHIIKPIVADMGKFFKKHSTDIHNAMKIVGQIIKYVIIVFGVLALIVGAVLVAAFVIVIGIIWVIIHVFGIVVDILKTVIKWMEKLISWVVSAGKAIFNFGKTVGKWFGSIGSTIKNAVTNAVSKASSWLVSAGKNIITGLINGIKGSMGKLGSVLGGIGNFIKDHKGPKAKDLAMLVPHGGWIMTGLMRGIRKSLPMLKRTLDDVSTTITPSSSNRTDPFNPYNHLPRPPGPGGTAMLANPSRSVQQTFHITTQEINPRRHAAELGYQLANQM